MVVAVTFAHFDEQIADQLLKDTKTLEKRTKTTTFSADKIGNGAKALMDEVATGKVTGEEEAWSHTDLWDFNANLQGSQTAVASVRRTRSCRSR